MIAINRKEKLNNFYAFFIFFSSLFLWDLNFYNINFKSIIYPTIIVSFFFNFKKNNFKSIFICGVVCLTLLIHYYLLTSIELISLKDVSEIILIFFLFFFCKNNFEFLIRNIDKIIYLFFFIFSLSVSITLIQNNFYSLSEINFNIAELCSYRLNLLNEEIIYNDSIYIATNYPTYMFFYLDEIEAQNDNLGFISILFSFSRYYSGAVNFNYFNETFNYDLVNCKRIFLDDIFSNKNLSKELKIIEKEVEITLPQSYSKETLSSWKNKSSPEWSFALSYEFSKVMCLIDNDFCSWTDSAIYSAPDLEFYKDFLIDREGIAFVFDKYQISCGGCNSPHPRILYKRLYRIIDFSKLGK